jgi:hypothetical protein
MEQIGNQKVKMSEVKFLEVEHLSIKMKGEEIFGDKDVHEAAQLVQVFGQKEKWNPLLHYPVIKRQ